MIKEFFLAMLVCIVSLSQTGCGLSIVQDWQASSGKAIIGGGAVAGKDYVNGLKPSENARKYFAKISANGDSPIETVRRTDDSPNKTSVRFVKNGGILIPPGVTISFTNKGYCMDPHLPAPKAGEEFQLVPMTQLIPEDLQGIYKKLLTKASSGDPSVQRNMQHLVWALRTAGTDAAFANNLTPQQKRILDRCSEYPGQFEEFNANAKANNKALKELIGLADSFLNIKIGGVSYKASDLLDPDVGNKKINEHLNQLIGMSQHLPVEKSGFNFGELQSGIYTDVRGSGVLAFTAKIANSSNKPYTFYPTDYVGQVGSGVSNKSSSLSFFATSSSMQRQRVTTKTPDEVNVDDQSEPDNQEEEEEDKEEEEWVCRQGCTDGCKKAFEAKRVWLKIKLSLLSDGYCTYHGIKLGWGIVSNAVFGKLSGKEKSSRLIRKKINLDLRKTVNKNALTGVNTVMGAYSATKTAVSSLEDGEAFNGEASIRTALGYADAAGVPIVGYYEPGRDIGETIAKLQTGEFEQELNVYLDNFAKKELKEFWEEHKKIKKKKQ